MSYGPRSFLRNCIGSVIAHVFTGTNHIDSGSKPRRGSGETHGPAEAGFPFWRWLKRLVPEHAVDIRNASDKCVVAISLSIKEKDSEGKLVATGNASFFRQRDGQFNFLGPGQTFSQNLSGSAIDTSGRPATPEVSVDFVIFRDGSTWGPGNDLEQKGYLRGKFDTYKHIQVEKNKQPCGSGG